MGERLKTLEPPVFGIFIGPSGSGKTTVTKRLSRIIDSTVVSKDDIADRYTLLRGDTYQDIRPQVYEEQNKKVKKALASRTSVFLDTTLSKEIQEEDWWKLFKEIADEYGALLKIIQLMVSYETCIRRMAARGLARDLDKLTPEGRERFRTEQFHGAAILPPEHSLVIRNEGDLKPIDFGLTIIRAHHFLTKPS